MSNAARLLSAIQLRMRGMVDNMYSEYELTLMQWDIAVVILSNGDI